MAVSLDLTLYSALLTEDLRVGSIVRLTPEDESEVDDSDAGWQTPFFSRLFDWHEPDPDLLWRFRPNLRTDYIQTNSEGLIGDPVVRPKPNGTFRILLLGDSSPVGLGLKSYRQAFGQVLRSLLQAELHKSLYVDIVTAAVAGYSSEQTRRWFELHGRAYEPDLVVLYVGNNDASISATVPDHELLAGQRMSALRRFLGNVATYRVLRGLLIGQSGSNSPDPELMVVRVSPERYARNVSAIVAECERRATPVVVVEPIVPYLWPAGLQFKVFERMRTGEGDLLLPEPVRRVLGRRIKYCMDWTDFERRYGHADWYTRAVYGSAFTDDMPSDRAIDYCLGQLALAPDDPVIINNIGVSHWQAGRFGTARRYLAQAMSAFGESHPQPRNPVEESAGAVFPYNLAVAWLSSDAEQMIPADTLRSVELLERALCGDYLSLRIKEEYSRAVRRRLSTTAASNWTVIALDSAFGRTPGSPLGAEDKFIDHCHPTATGHRLIAEQVLRELN